MSTAQNPFDLLVEKFRQVVREEIRAAMSAAAAAIETKREPVKDWMRADDLAKEFNLPRTWFEERGREGKIQRTKPGRYVLFKRSDVERFLESESSGGKNGNGH